MSTQGPAVAFVCPWCPVTVVGFGAAADAARHLIEHHLDEHLSQTSPVSIPHQRQPPPDPTGCADGEVAA